MNISIIIPVYEEDEELNLLLSYILENSSNTLITEVIVVDYNNSSQVRNDNVIVLQSPKKGRAEQMQYASTFAKGDVFYFLHADSFPPTNFDQHIAEAIRNGKPVGCFRLKFNIKSTFLAFFAWFTRFPLTSFRGGDQSMYVSKNIFQEVGGFDTSLKIMEDIDIVKRIKKISRFTVLKQSILTSPRRYNDNGVIKLQFHFGVLLLMYNLGSTQQSLHKYYRKHIT